MEQGTRGFEGIFNVLVTPFTEEGEVDEDSLRELIEFLLARGVDGFTALGVAGEAAKLSREERELVTEVVLDAAAGRVPVVVGTSHNTTSETVDASVASQEAGVKGIMVAPPKGLQPGDGLTEHFKTVGQAVEIPIILQDYPAATGVTMSPRQMAHLVDAVPAISTIKLEGTPTAYRMAETQPLLRHGCTVMGGMGGLYFFDELRRGSRGIMTGFAYPEGLVGIWRAWCQGNRDEAMRLYYKHLPMLVFEGQPDIGLSIRKETLRRRGLIRSAKLRSPAIELTEDLAADLSEVSRFLGLDDMYA